MSTYPFFKSPIYPIVFKNNFKFNLATLYFQFVAHPNIQQLLAALWYEGVPGFRRKAPIEKLLIILRVALLFPLYCTAYMMAPNCSMSLYMKKPFMKFLIHASSYLFFLCKCVKLICSNYV